MRIGTRTLIEYVDTRGKVPFRHWLEKLKDRKAVATIDARSNDIKLAQQYWAEYLEEE